MTTLVGYLNREEIKELILVLDNKDQSLGVTEAKALAEVLKVLVSHGGIVEINDLLTEIKTIDVKALTGSLARRVRALKESAVTWKIEQAIGTNALKVGLQRITNRLATTTNNYGEVEAAKDLAILAPFRGVTQEEAKKDHDANVIYGWFLKHPDEIRTTFSVPGHIHIPRIEEGWACVGWRHPMASETFYSKWETTKESLHEFPRKVSAPNDWKKVEGYEEADKRFIIAQRPPVPF